MSHFLEIKTILLANYPTATVRKLNNGRIESESQKTTTFPLIICKEDFSSDISKNKSGQLKTSSRYTWLFLDQDDWDNRTNENDSGQIDEATDEIIERMRTTANKVFFRWSNRSGGTIFGGGEGDRPKWQISNYSRKQSSTMSGVMAVLTFVQYENDFCL